ncbi:MAG: RagB/SusD family nutrient uptake outer membrane protein [Bacteroidales bacterium]|nr:RagB/SusD family nutrient uptake outer membrane protein [Bacteroidales bacterium]
MNSINKLMVVFAVLGIFIFQSCEKSVLDKPPRDVFSEVDVWNDIELAKKFQTTIYNGLWLPNYYEMYAASSDEALSAENISGINNFTRGQIAADYMMQFAPIWAYEYRYIRKANIFLEGIDGMAGDEQVKNVLKGETKFLRARMYFDLIKLFGGVPLITEVFELDDDFIIPRDSYEKIVDWIVKELDEAANLVPAERAASEWGRITKGVCLATKSNVLLHANSKLHDPSTAPGGPLFDYSKNTWQQCADAAKAVIDMPHYSLQSVNTWQDYHRIFIEPNPEIIFAKVFHNNYGSRARHICYTNAPVKDGGWAEHTPLQGLIDDYEMENGKKFYEEGSGFDPSPEGLYNNREKRFYANILYHGSVWKTPLDVVYPGGGEVSTPPYVCAGYRLRKFMDENIQYLAGENGDSPWIWLRLAEMYLNYAEAMYELGHEDVAREYVNLIRDRVGLPERTSSGVELFNDIIHERRIELCFEFHRFFDVRRWMIADSTDNKDAMGIIWEKLDSQGNLDPNGTLSYRYQMFYERQFLDKMYYLPIPYAEIVKTQLEQNPGY